MKTSLLLCFFICISSFFLRAQSEAAVQLLDEGVELHDRGDYQGALAKYNAALELEEGDYFIAEAEIATTLFFMEEFEACIELCEELIKRYPNAETLELVYTTLGNALDLSGRPEEAIDVYERAIGQFPEDHLLRFNLGVTYLRKEELKRGKEQLIAGIKINPLHPGGHFVLGVTLTAEGKRSPAIFAFLNFLLLEFETQRSQQAFETLCSLLEGNIYKKSRKSVNIEMPPKSVIDDDYPDNFIFVDYKLDWEANMAQGKQFKKLERKMNAVEIRTEKVWSLTLTAANRMKEGKLHGPLADLYVPFFSALESNGHLETLMYMTHVDSGDKYVDKWLEDHFDQVKSLVDWALEEDRGNN